MRADRRDEGLPDHRRASPVRTLGWRKSWRIAGLVLHLGFRGLRLLFVCLFLCVATLAAIGSLTSAITDELAARGQTLLGGDIEIAMTQREASASEKAALGGLGALSETIRMRAMAPRPGAAGGDEPRAVLTDVNGVAAAYPPQNRQPAGEEK